MNNIDTNLTIGDFIKRKTLKIETPLIKVDIHESLVEVYRKMSYHEEKTAIVYECLKEQGYIKLRNIEHMLLNQYFPHL